MKCSKCKTENPETRKFCRECGAKLMFICSHCGLENVPGDKYCGECGQTLIDLAKPTPKEPTFDEKLAKIQKYLPSGLTEKILSQRDRIEGERKQVTVLFCDMEGFTPLVEKMGPEESYAFMDQVYEILIHKVHDYEGTVNEMTGDGIMALFGAPITLEDAPQRAIRSAIAIHREMARFSETLRRGCKEIPPLRMRIGIHTGPVVVGALGNDLRIEFKAVGDTVNLASRMEGIAEPGSTYITGDTFRLTEGFFHFEALGEREIKGKEKPVKVYRVIEPAIPRTKFEVHAERGLTPFIGRERDITLLLDGLEMAKSGNGQAYSIAAGPGLGKSRLLYEFRKTVSKEDITLWEGRCFSYTKDVAYYPLVETLRCCFDLREDDGDEEIRQKVKKGINELGIDEPATLPYILGMLSVRDTGSEIVFMSPEARQYGMMGAMSQIFIAKSQERPLIVAIEDIHWIDKASELALKYLVDSLSGSRVFLLVTYRTGYIPPWSGKSHYHQLNLNRLSNKESLTIAWHLLDTDHMDEALEVFFIQKTEGVPFFMEEFISSLDELKFLVKKGDKYCLVGDARNITIPSTIHDVIMARVDALPDDVKELLQTGSVIEREFSYRLLEQVTGISQEELLSQLAILNSSELLYTKGPYPNSSYVFKNALTRDVVYDSILTKRKKSLHERIGKTMEELYKDNLKQYADTLAGHFILCDDYRKGAEYSDIAREKAVNSSSYAVASTHARNRVMCLEKLPVTEEVQSDLIEASTVLARYLFGMNKFHEAKESVDPVVVLAEQRNQRRSLSHIYTILGGYYFIVEEDSAKAIKSLEKASEISHEMQDFSASFLTDYFLGLALSWDCQFERGLDYMEKALGLPVAFNATWGISVMKSALSLYGYNYHGEVKKGYQLSSEALHLAEGIGDLYSRATAYVSHGASCFYKGDFKNAEEFLLKGSELSDRVNLLSSAAIAHQYLGYNYTEAGDYRKSLDHFNRAHDLRRESRFFLSTAKLILIASSLAKVMSGDNEIVLKSLYDLFYSNRMMLHTGAMARTLGLILLSRQGSDMNEVHLWLDKAVEEHKQCGMRWDLGRDYKARGELFKRLGELKNAEENLSRSTEIFVECGADGWARETERIRSEL